MHLAGSGEGGDEVCMESRSWAPEKLGKFSYAKQLGMLGMRVFTLIHNVQFTSTKLNNNVLKLQFIWKYMINKFMRLKQNQKI